MKEKIVRFFKAFSRMPYKWYWIAMMLCSMILFSWWDEIAIWGLGATWDWRIVPIYYIVEYGVMIPLMLYMGKKTYAKLNLDINLRQLLIQSLKNSLPVLLYRKIKEKISKRGEKANGKKNV